MQLRTDHGGKKTGDAGCTASQKFYYSPTDGQLNCLKNNIKICIKIYIKTAATCFGAVTPSSGAHY
jgi:hypothetical protein